MSGGTFDYKQYYLDEIADEIEERIRKNGAPKPYEDIESWDKRWWSEEHNDTGCTIENYEKDPLTYEKHPDNIINEFKVAHVILKLAAMYVQRIDWLLAGDDGYETFFERIEEDFGELNTYLTDTESKAIIEHIKKLIK